MRVRSLGLSSGQSQVVVDVLVLLTWTFLVPALVTLSVSPWRRLLSTERALLLLGVGLAMAVLTVTAEAWRARRDRARRFADQLHLLGSLLEPKDIFEPMTPEQWRELERICR